jgi:hypothetical protein
MTEENTDARSYMRNHFLAQQQAFGANVYTDFLLANAVAYLPGPDTYKVTARRGEAMLPERHP